MHWCDSGLCLLRSPDSNQIKTQSWSNLSLPQKLSRTFSLLSGLTTASFAKGPQKTYWSSEAKYVGPAEHGGALPWKNLRAVSQWELGAGHLQAQVWTQGAHSRSFEANWLGHSSTCNSGGLEGAGRWASWHRPWLVSCVISELCLQVSTLLSW